MFNLKELFKPGIIRPQVGHRVKHNATREMGTVEGRAQVNGSTKVWVITVKYDNGTTASMVSENEFTAMGRA